MIKLSENLEQLIHEFSQLPGIGRKTAQRLAYFVLKQPRESIEKLSTSLMTVKDNVMSCEVCFNISDERICKICESEKRNKFQICVVEEPTDVIAIEKTNEFNGVYHVLGGAISPLDGITPDQLKINELLKRLTIDGEFEIILATNPNVEGEATSLYLIRLLKNIPNIMVTRIARGVPIGGDLEYSDEATLARAMEGRVKI